MNRFVMLIGLTATLTLSPSKPTLAQVYQTYYASPAAAYYQPTQVTAAYYAPATTYYAPAVAYYSPAPVTYFYASPVTTTFYRPVLGGTVSGWRYNNAPVTYAYPSTVAYYPAW